MYSVCSGSSYVSFSACTGLAHVPTTFDQFVQIFGTIFEKCRTIKTNSSSLQGEQLSKEDSVFTCVCLGNTESVAGAIT